MELTQGNARTSNASIPGCRPWDGDDGIFEKLSVLSFRTQGGTWSRQGMFVTPDTEFIGIPRVSPSLGPVHRY